MARRAHIEDDIQKAVVSHLMLRGAPGLVFWHTPNAPRNAQTGARLKSMGMRAGVSDLILVHDERIYALELKSPGNRATEAQLEFISDMNHVGAFCAVCDGLDRALRVLELWGLLRGVAA